MNNSVKLLTILLAMIVTSGQAWAQDPSNKPPYFIDKDNIKLAVPEEKTKAKAGCVEAGDEENDGYTFEITGGTAQDLFDIGLTTGNVTMKNGVEPFDYEAWKESGTKYAIVVDLCDTRATTFNTNLCTQAMFTVSVTDVNEKPYFTNQSDVISIAEGATISTDAITYADPDKYTDEYLNNELVITGGASDLFELTSDGYVKPKDGAVIEKSEYEIVVRVRDANKDGENYIYPDLYNDKTFTIRYYATAVDYMDWDESTKTLVSKNTKDLSPAPKVYILTGGGATTLDGGWYVVEDNVAYTGQLRFNGDAHIILANDCKMTVGTEDSPIDADAISVNGNISIYGQSSDEKTMGSLIANSRGDNYCGILGNNNIIINSGNVTVKGNSSGIVAIHNVTINSGEVKAIGVNNEGIEVILGEVTINGGQVTTSGKTWGIKAVQNITITGGQVTATGGSDGIYTYSSGGSASVTINGGQVTATSTGTGSNAHGIYARNSSGTANVFINGGQVTATGGTYGIYAYSSSGSASITLGWTNATDYIYASSYKAEIGSSGTASVKTADGKAMKAFVPAATESDSDKPFAYIAGGHTLTANELTALAGKKLVPNPDGLAYLDWDDSQKKLVSKNTTTDTDPASADPTNPNPLTANDFVYVLQGNPSGGETLGGGWYVAEGEVAYTGGLTITGDTHLILADDATLTVGNTAQTNSGLTYKVGIYAEGDFTIYGQTSNGGTLDVTADDNYNAIWCYDNNLTFNSGKVVATAYVDNAIQSYPGNITINGGDITAISSGLNGFYADKVTINGGTVKAEGDDAIVAQNTVSITGGTVKTTGIYQGIIANYDITISGGKVTATGDESNFYCGINSLCGNISLGWTNADDYIYASSYRVDLDAGHTCSTTAGQRFVAWTPAATEGGAEEASSIVGSGSIADFAAIDGKVLRPLAVAETGDDGVVTTYPGYVVSTPAGLTLSGKTAPDFTLSDKPYYIYKADDVVTLSTDKNYGQDGIELTGTNVPATVSSSTATTASFDMPAADVTINGLKYYNTGVKYMDWNGEKLVDKTTNANDKVYILTGGGATDLPGGWYVVNNWNTDATDGTDAAYTGMLQFTGDAHIILADGAEMTVGTEDVAAIKGNNASIAIYSQSEGEGMGALTASSLNYNAIYIINNDAKDHAVTINGGKVTAHGSDSYYGIAAISFAANSNASITINGGEVTAEGSPYFGIYAYSNTGIANLTINGGHVEATGDRSAIHVYASTNTANLTITGGQVEAIGSSADGYYGIQATTVTGTANLILSLTNCSDFIKANSYGATVDNVSGSASAKIPAGKALAYTDGSTTTILGSTTDDYIFDDGTNASLASIANQTLRVSKNMPVSAVNAQYAALYQEDGDWKVTDPDVKMYVPTGNIIKNGNAYEMELKEVTGGGIPNGVPIIVGKEGGLSDITFMGTSADEANTIETNYTAANPSPAFFVGDGTKTLNELIIAALGDGTDPADYIAFTLIGDKLVALDDSGADVKAGTCIFVISKLDVLQMVQGTYAPPAGARQRGIPFDLGGGTTGIGLMDNGEWIMDNYSTQWYDLQGRKLDTAPTKKGVYINRGKKVIIR